MTTYFVGFVKLQYLANCFAKLLKYSIPNYLSGNEEIKKFISSISVAEKKDGGDGAIIIKLKNL